MVAEDNKDAFLDARGLILEDLSRQRGARKRMFAALAALSLLLAHLPILVGLSRRFLPEAMSWTTFAAVSLMLILMILMASAVVFGRPLLRRRTIASMLVVYAVLLFTPLVLAGKPEPFEDIVAHGWICYLIGTVLSLVTFSLFLAARRLIRRSPAALVMVGLASGTVGVTALYHFCPYDGVYHLLFTHGGIVVPIVILALAVLLPRANAGDPE